MPVRNPLQALIVAFVAWKAFLLAIAAGSCFGVAYDTSASLALDGAGVGNSSTPTLITRLTSWDAVYFTQIARRGYLFEQEWAFGSGLPITISYFSKALAAVGIEARGYPLDAPVGILVANASHLVSVLILYRLGKVVFHDSRLALVAASLHIFSPAGLFLSAPYAESTCSLLSFAGNLLFAESCQKHRRPASRDALILLAGVSFGLATAFRSNGILNGILFAWQFCEQLARLAQHPADAIRRLVVLGIGGLCVAGGSIGPQLVAYLRYCSTSPEADLRPWCHGYMPSIYTFVQQHYWNVGFLRYWTLSNVPLFLLAAPMLYILTKSGLDQLASGIGAQSEDARRLAVVLQPAAMAQVLLTFLAITSYHVQVITRLSSGYPLWYLWLARQLSGRETSDKGRGIVRFMIMYAAIQGALFVSFLPPA